jgi:hypothetical protein
VRWREALALAGIAASTMLLIQLERLVVPYVLPIADLALYGVLAAIAGSLFRLLQMGVGFTLLPRLRAAQTVSERRRLVLHELRLVVAISAAGGAAIFALTPLVERWLLAGKYHLSAALLAAAVVSGVAKIANAFVKSAATALATARELALANALGWISVALGAAAAIVGARWGLAGVVYGVGLGWLFRAAASFTLVAKHFRVRNEPAAATALGGSGVRR